MEGVRCVRKALALLLAAIFSIFAGIEIIKPKNDEFSVNVSGATYYEPVKDEVNYTLLYTEMFGSNDAAAEKCKTQPTHTERESWVQFSDAYPNFYVPVYQADGTEFSEANPSSINFASEHKFSFHMDGEPKVGEDTEFYICAPASGTIETSHYACDYGHRMTYTFTLNEVDSNGRAVVVPYVMTISGAKCWYCCKDKKVPDNFMYQANTQDTLQGKKMSAGDLLCVGHEGTTVVIGRA